jgi:hypothetical protein
LATGTTDHFSYAPLVLNGIFGTVIGIYSSTYVNWTKAGSELRRALKASVVSLMFAALIIPLTGANKLEGIDSLSLSVLVVAAAIGANILGNNFAKVAFQEWALIKERKRTDTGNWTLKMPFPKLELHRARPGGGGQPRLSIVIEWLEYETAFRKRDINFQWTSGLPVNFLKNADLVGVPLGTFTLWASIPFVKAMTILWAKKKYPDDEELHTRMKESWDETWGHYFDVIAHPAQYGDLLGRLTNKAWKFHQQSAAEKLLTFEESLIQFSSDFIRSSQNAMSSIKRSCESRILGITAAVGALF